MDSSHYADVYSAAYSNYRRFMMRPIKINRLIYHCICGNYYAGSYCHECGRVTMVDNTCTIVPVKTIDIVAITVLELMPDNYNYEQYIYGFILIVLNAVYNARVTIYQNQNRYICPICGDDVIVENDKWTCDNPVCRNSDSEHELSEAVSVSMQLCASCNQVKESTRRVIGSSRVHSICQDCAPDAH